VKSARIALLALAATFAASAHARIIALDIDLPLDQIGPGQPFKPGDHHHARIFYDDATVDATTHVVRVLHMQHLLGPAGWVPARVDAEAMPMTDAWRDLSRIPYRYHYRSAVLQNGEAILVDFDERNERMTIRSQRDQAVLVSAPYEISTHPVTGLDTSQLFLRPPAYVMHEVDVTVDQAAAGEPSKAGDHDKVRIVYDDSEVDPSTHRVKLKNLQHFIGGRYSPQHPDAVFMPMDDAWLDLGQVPFSLHYRARVTHGKPIVLEFDAGTHRFTVRPQAEPNTLLEGGSYLIDPRPITGPEAIAAATGH
jgi:hypothetical protein